MYFQYLFKNFKCIGVWFCCLVIEFEQIAYETLEPIIAFSYLCCLNKHHANLQSRLSLLYFISVFFLDSTTNTKIFTYRYLWYKNSDKLKNKDKLYYYCISSPRYCLTDLYLSLQALVYNPWCNPTDMQAG